VKMIKMYELPNCSTCRKAMNFLLTNRYPVERVDITTNPPSIAELKEMLVIQGGNIKKLFNTTGKQYQAMGMKDQVAKMTEAEALKLLASNGKLIKRPFILWEGKGLVGFDPKVWKKIFAE